MAAPDWKTGTGYPTVGATIDDWESEFLSRGEQELKGWQYIKRLDGRVQLLLGPGMLATREDGSLQSGPDDRLATGLAMLIRFELDQDIGHQIERARAWLNAYQRPRFNVERQRKRESQFELYLRALDADKAGASLDEIAQVLYPNLGNSYPSHEGRKKASKALAAARKLARRGLRPPLIERLD